MVQRVRLLLMVVLGLLGCSTEALKIHIPPVGIESVHQEDLRRAYWKLERGTNPQQWWSIRARQVHLSRTDTKGCFVHLGKHGVDDLTVLVIAEPLPIQLSMLGSLAKAVDGVDTVQDWLFCLSSSRAVNAKAVQTIDLSQEKQSNLKFVDVQFEELEQHVRQLLIEQGVD